jgi:hypothetical protein
MNIPLESTASAATKHPLGAVPARRKPEARSRVTNGSDVLPGVDGRTEIARRFFDICQSLIQDAAGVDRCSEAKLQLIRRFAAAAVMAENLEAKLARGEEIDIQEHATLSSTLVRLGARIGINRVAKNITPSLSDILRGPP